jgi:DNA-binding transcriptional regulator YdaS (Cro superfamily)
VERPALVLGVDQSRISRWLAAGPACAKNAAAIERFLANPEAALPSQSARADKVRLAHSDCLRLQLRGFCQLQIGRKKQLATAVGVSQQLVSDWLSGPAPIAIKHCPAIERFLAQSNAEPVAL